MTTQMEHRPENPLELSPTGFSGMVAAAHEKAKVLADIVERAHLYADINGKKYLNVEAWQIIGRAYGYTARTSGVIGVEETAISPAGVMARSDVYDANGTLVGGAEGWCMDDEPTWAGRPFYARAGMAQTRATSRAFRQLLSWVVVLAGYAPTPAEEMTGDARPLTTQTAIGDLCPVHGVKFFQSSKMREPAHKLDDGSWCNKSKVVVKVAERPAPPTPLRAEPVVGSTTDSGLGQEEQFTTPAQPRVDHWAALEPEARTALRERGITTLQAATILGAPLDAWLAQDKLRTPAEAMRLIREAKTKQAGGG